VGGLTRTVDYATFAAELSKMVKAKQAKKRRPPKGALRSPVLHLPARAYSQPTALNASG
jgi:hypothetical protein